MNSIYDDAKDLLITHGWAKGDNPGRCVIDAIYDCGGSKADTLPLHVLVEQMWPARLEPVIGVMYSPVAQFNDHPETVFLDVCDLLDAAHAREQELDNEIDGLLYEQHQVYNRVTF